MLSSQHQDVSFCLSFFWKLVRGWPFGHRQSRHLGFTDKWVSGRAFRQSTGSQRFDSLWNVKGRWRGSKRIRAFDSLQDIPDAPSPRSDQAFCSFDVARDITRNDFTHDEWFEELDRHFTWHTTLVHLKSWTNGDNGTSWEVQPVYRASSWRNFVSLSMWLNDFNGHTWSCDWTTTTTVIDQRSTASWASVFLL